MSHFKPHNTMHAHAHAHAHSHAILYMIYDDCRPVKFPDTLTMGARNELVDATRGEFIQHYAAKSKTTGTVVAEGMARIVMVNSETGKRARVPSEWVTMMAPATAAAEE